MTICLEKTVDSEVIGRARERECARKRDVGGRKSERERGSQVV